VAAGLITLQDSGLKPTDWDESTTTFVYDLIAVGSFIGMVGGPFIVSVLAKLVQMKFLIVREMQNASIDGVKDFKRKMRFFSIFEGGIIASIAMAKLRGDKVSLDETKEVPPAEPWMKPSIAEVAWKAKKQQAMVQEFGREYKVLACFAPGVF
jgi:hypothetical protein